MGRHNEITLALAELLRGVRGEATGLYAVGVPMVAQGFSQEEIASALISLDRKKVIELLPDNQMRVLIEPNGLRESGNRGERS